MWKTTGLQIGSNIQPPIVRSMDRPAAAVAATPAMTVERMGDLLGVFLFKVLRISDRAYKQGLEGLPVVLDTLAISAEMNEKEPEVDAGYHSNGSPTYGNSSHSQWELYYGGK